MSETFTVHLNEECSSQLERTAQQLNLSKVVVDNVHGQPLNKFSFSLQEKEGENRESETNNGKLENEKGSMKTVHEKGRKNKERGKKVWEKKNGEVYESEKLEAKKASADKEREKENEKENENKESGKFFLLLAVL